MQKLIDHLYSKVLGVILKSWSIQFMLTLLVLRHLSIFLFSYISEPNNENNPASFERLNCINIARNPIMLENF